MAGNRETRELTTRSSRYADEPLDPPVARVTIVLEKFGAAESSDEGPVIDAQHQSTQLIRVSHLVAIQRKHGLSLIKWLETALEIELEALIDDTTWEIQR